MSNFIILTTLIIAFLAGFFDAEGNLVAEAKSFVEDFLVVEDFKKRMEKIKEVKGIERERDNEVKDIYNALIIGVKDYFKFQLPMSILCVAQKQ